MESEKVMILCMRAEDAKRSVGLGSINAECGTCRAAVLFAPSSVELKSEMPDIEIVCNRCFEKSDPDEVVRFAISQKAIEEFERMVFGVHNN